jgi:hypothetical protein
MKEIIIKKWCDMCWLDGEQRTASTQSWTVGILAGENRPIPRVVETCETHGKVIGDLLELTGNLELLPTSGEQASAKVVPNTGRPPRSVDGEYAGVRMECPACHVEYSKSSLALHIWTRHQHQPGRPPQPTNCPDCGEYLESAGAMGMHRRGVHGYDPIEEALQGLPGFPSVPTKATRARR